MAVAVAVAVAVVVVVKSRRGFGRLAGLDDWRVATDDYAMHRHEDAGLG